MKTYAVYVRHKGSCGKWGYIDSYSADTSESAINVCIDDMHSTAVYKFGFSSSQARENIADMEFKAVLKKSLKAN